MKNDYREIPIKYPLIFFTFSVIIFIISIIVISTDKWVRVVAHNEEEYVGLFYTSGNAVMVSCNTDTSVSECGYLLSARCSGFLSLLFTTCAMVGYYYIATNFQFYAIPGYWWALTAFFGILASAFSLICVVIYYFFKTSYLTTNDDQNIEYSAIDGITTSEFEWSYWALAGSSILNIILSLSNVSLNSSTVRRILNIQPHAASYSNSSK